MEDERCRRGHEPGRPLHHVVARRQRYPNGGKGLWLCWIGKALNDEFLTSRVTRGRRCSITMSAFHNNMMSFHYSRGHDWCTGMHRQSGQPMGLNAILV